MTHDALIVGAGPAGATLGGLLARAGLQVLLVEKARFPRPKPCGECLNPGALAALRRLGLWEAAAALEPVPLRGWRLQGVDLDYPPGLHAAAVDRRRFDHALVEWAAAQGASVEEGTAVGELLWDADGRVTGARAGRLRLEGRVTVGADGLRSVVLRRLGLRAPSRSAPRVALTAHWEGVADLTDRGEMHVWGGAACGIAPLGRGAANVVLVVPAAAARGLTQEMALARWPALSARFAAARRTTPTLATGPFDQPVKAVTAPGALLVGDAAGYFDPFTGQGIYRALRTAELAAGAIVHGQPYLPEAEFGPAVRRQRLVDGVVRRPHLLGAALWGLGRWPGAGAWLLRLLGDCPFD